MKVRHTSRFSIANSTTLKQQLLHWANTHFDTLFYFDSNQSKQDKQQRFDGVLACGCEQKIVPQNNSLMALRELETQTQDWLFGAISYDLKNEIENLKSENFDRIDFPTLYFIQPKYVFTIANNLLEIHHFETDIASVWNDILATQIPLPHPQTTWVKMQQRTSKQAYIERVEAILQQIRAGIVYEMNFCIEFFAETTHFLPLPVFEILNRKANAPFSGFVKINHLYLLCASPERYLQRTGQRLVSQPIKGTAKRGKTPQEDQNLRTNLQLSTKERAENIMIVDLVRNDFHRICQTGSVAVEELCQIYSFDTVHQMISTICGKIDPSTTLADCLLTTFPMGSMTGAPKISAMQLIEQFETTKRGIYSGTIGYIQACKDFDFNVVIRSIAYNAKNNYLSVQIGSAITIDSIAEQEYEECLLKAKALLEVLQTTPIVG